MKLGAQLYSVRKYTQNDQDYEFTFKTIKEMGYECVQVSGGFAIDPCKLRDLSIKYQLPITCTHSSFDRIVNDTQALIEEHKIYGCPVIGIGSMPKEYRGSIEGLENFLKIMEEPVKKIIDAGLGFSYHNHDFEFKPLENGAIPYDIMLERCPDWKFLLDTYWVEFAGYSTTEYIAKIGADRLTNIHFKDLANDEKRSICACGQGVLDFKKYYDACISLGGVENVLVEQDNASTMEDPMGQMQLSFDHLRPIIK